MEDPPANRDATLHMLLVDPDGHELPANDSVVLSMNVYGLNASGEYGLLQEIQNRDTVPGELLRAGASLELRPVVAYGGVKMEGQQGWMVRPTDLPPTLKNKQFFKVKLLSGAKEGISLGKIKDVVEDRETPAEDILLFNSGEDGPLLRQDEGTIFLVSENSWSWPFWKTYRFPVMAEDASGQTALANWSVTAVAVLPILLGIVFTVIAVRKLLRIRRGRKAKREEEKQEAEKLRNDQMNSVQLYEKELTVDQTFIRAGLCWTLQDEQGETTHIGGLGLTDEEGRLQGGCDLSKAQVYCLDEEGHVVDCENPLDFGLWRYSATHKCTELLLNASLTISDCGIGKLKRRIKGPPGTEGDIICFGVNKALPYREVRLETSGGTFIFHLEYYTDYPPFYL